MITDFPSLESAIKRHGPPLLLFSGGLDGAFLIATLGCKEMVALTVCLGGDPASELAAAVCSRAGIRHERADGRDRFVSDFVLPAIRAHAVYAGTYPICASLSRPLLAEIAIERANALGCGVIVHTSNPSQNSLRRFNGALRQSSLRFKGEFGSPFASSRISRDEKCRLLTKAGFPEYGGKAISLDTNIWGREFEFGPLDDPEQIEVPEELFVWTRRRKQVLSSRRIAIRLQKGCPSHLNGVPHSAPEIIERLNDAAGQFCIGRYIGLEEIESGAKVQEVREMPAATVLLDAYRRLEAACLPYECIKEKMQIEQTWTREAAEGRWFGELRAACGAFIDLLASNVSGEVEYDFTRGQLGFRGLRAERPLYVRDRRALD